MSWSSATVRIHSKWLHFGKLCGTVVERQGEWLYVEFHFEKRFSRVTEYHWVHERMTDFPDRAGAKDGQPLQPRPS